MAEVIDPSQIAGPQETAAAPGMQAATTPNVINPADIADPLPDHSSGLDPKTPINQSPLSIADRFKMSLGNEKGNMDYLMNKPDVKAVVKDSTGHFVLQSANDGLWYRVDPEGGGDGDAWSRTKEIMKDAADIAPAAVKTLGAIGAGIAAAPVTGGLGSAVASGVVGAGLEGYRTSLGRLVGTYQATEGEQMQDLGMEALLNLGGAAVGAGVKPAARLLSKAAGGIADAIEHVAPATANAVKETISSTIGAVTGAGQKAVRTLLDAGEDVSATLSKALAGRSREQAVDFLKNENVGVVKDIARRAQPALNKIYSTVKGELMDTAGEGFKGDVDDVLRASYADGLKSNIGAVVRDGKVLNVTPEQILKDGLPEGAQFGLHTIEHLQSIQRQSGQINPLANDPESYKLIAELHSTLKNFANMGEQSGKRGLNNLLEMKKVIGDVSFKLGTAADEAGLNVAKRYIAQVESHVENRMLESMPAEVQKKYTQLMADYSNAKDQAAPLINALKQSRNRGDAVFEPLLNKLSSRPGSNAAIKDQFSNAVELMSQQGDKEIKNLLQRIDVHDAASKFIPVFRKGIGGALGVSAGGTAAMLGHPEVAMGIGAAGVAAAPRTALMSIRGAQNLSQGSGLNLAVKSMWSLKDMIGNLDPKARQSLVQNPFIFNGLFQAAMRTPQMAQGIEQTLVDHGLSQAAPTQISMQPQGDGSGQ